VLERDSVLLTYAWHAFLIKRSSQNTPNMPSWPRASEPRWHIAESQSQYTCRWPRPMWQRVERVPFRIQARGGVSGSFPSGNRTWGSISTLKIKYRIHISLKTINANANSLLSRCPFPFFSLRKISISSFGRALVTTSEVAVTGTPCNLKLTRTFSYSEMWKTLHYSLCLRRVDEAHNSTAGASSKSRICVVEVCGGGDGDGVKLTHIVVRLNVKIVIYWKYLRRCRGAGCSTTGTRGTGRHGGSNTLSSLSSVKRYAVGKHENIIDQWYSE